MPLTINEIQGDLFETDETSSLAHCVSEDLAMSKGISSSRALLIT